VEHRRKSYAFVTFSEFVQLKPAHFFQSEIVQRLVEDALKEFLEPSVNLNGRPRLDHVVGIKTFSIVLETAFQVWLIAAANKLLKRFYVISSHFLGIACEGLRVLLPREYDDECHLDHFAKQTSVGQQLVKGRRLIDEIAVIDKNASRKENIAHNGTVKKRFIDFGRYFVALNNVVQKTRIGHRDVVNGVEFLFHGHERKRSALD
jgi:hypothetical protein